MKEGFRTGILIELAYACILGIVSFICARFFMGLFVSRADANYAHVMDLGTKYLKAMAFLYLLPSLTNGVQGYFRGIGDLKVTLASTFMNMLARVACAALLVYGLHLTESLHIYIFAIANFVGWIFMLLFEVPLLRKHLKMLL